MKRPPRQALIFGSSMLVVLVIIAGGFRWRTDQTNKAAEESRRSDFAQCVVLNENREAIRIMATVQYGSLSDRLRFDPPEDQRLTKAFKKRLVQLEALLKAQRPLDCSTYVRPEVPPDRG